MPSSRSEAAELSALQSRYSDDTRYVDLCLSFRPKSDPNREILRVGGRWDNIEADYLNPDPEDLKCAVVWLNGNQVPVVERFAAWLEARIAGGPRKRLLLTGGGRRGGKSWILARLLVAVAIAIPDAICWLVSPTLKKRAELERYIKATAPKAWRSYSARDLQFRFVNGSTATNVTGDDAEAIKQGEADLVALNEPQMMSEDVLTYGAPAIIDKGGLMLFAGNPSRRRKGVWFTRLWKSIEAGKYPQGDVVRLSAKDNPNIDASARSDMGELLNLVNPDAARKDDEGIFEEPGSFAYAEHFDEARNTAPHLDIAPLITASLIRAAGMWGKFDTLNGVDFQGWPFNAGVSLQATGPINDPTWYVTGCLMVPGEEDYFLDDAYAKWDRERTLWIGDASGTWQDAQHVRGRCSFDKFKERHWAIEPPQTKKSDRGEHPANPSREDRVNLVNGLLRRGRLIVCLDDAAPVAEALAKCEVDIKGKPRGRYAHITDALGYALWWVSPKAEEYRGISGPPMVTISVTRGQDPY